MSVRSYRFCYIATSVIVVLFGLFLRLSSTLHRPLEEDEINSAWSYTTFVRAANQSDFQSLRPFMVGETVKGLARCFSYWKGPHNHIIHNALVSVFTFFGGFSEATMRGTSVVSSILLAALLMWWVHRHCHSVLLATLLGLVVMVHPYFQYYGQTARGYALTACLVMAQILLIDTIRARQRYGLFWLFLTVMASYFNYLNLISTALTWLLPLCLVLFFEPEPLPDANGQETKPIGIRALWGNNRQFWFWHNLAFFFLIAQFIAFHLPAFLVAKESFGVAYAGLGGVLEALKGFRTYFFPSAWVLVGLLALIGWGLMLTRKYYHWLGPAMGISFFLTMTYLVVCKNVPYNRTFGCVLVIALVSVGWLWRASNRFSRALEILTKSAVSIILLVAFALGVTAKSSDVFPVDPVFLATKIREEIQSCKENKDDTLVMLPYAVAQEMKFYLPTSNAFYLPCQKQPHIHVYFPCASQNDSDFFRCQTFDRSKLEFHYWPLPPQWKERRFFSNPRWSIYRVPFTVTRLNDINAFDRQSPPGLTVVWIGRDSYFDLRRLIAEKIKPQIKPWNVDLLINVASSPLSVTFFSTDQNDVQSIKEILRDLTSRTDGEVYVLKPDLSAE